MKFEIYNGVIQMSKYIIRLDDASEYMDIQKWAAIETLLDEYEIKPIVGIIPQNRDAALISKYKFNSDFWTLVKRWTEKNWIPAMHGYEHCYISESGGMNPVHQRSEFAGISYDEQCKKIKKGYSILKNHEIYPDIFFAPSHTFDKNTLLALRAETSIRIISDTIAYDIYKKADFWFIPQQCGAVRKLPFKMVTFCYHPNSMQTADFGRLNKFLKNNREKFVDFDFERMKDRKFGCFDLILKKLYFIKHKT